MMTGAYPDGVPAAYRIPPATFASADDVGRFVDVAAQLGVRSVRPSGGMLVDDFDDDGRFDIVTSTIESCGPLQFFHGNGDGTFTERTAAAGLGDQLGGLNIMQADYNNDGCPDILVLRGGWEVPQRKSLLRNNCDGTFTDVTVASGLARPSTTVADGRVDRREQRRIPRPLRRQRRQPRPAVPERRTGTSTTSRRRAGVDRQSFAKGVVGRRLRQRRFADLYVSNYDGANFLYRNNRQRHLHRARAGGRRARSRARALRPGSSTTTTTAGSICSSRATSSVDDTVAHLPRAAAQRADAEAVPEPW